MTARTRPETSRRRGERGEGSLLSRREILHVLSTLGIGSAVFGRSLVALAEEAGRVTPDMIRKAEWISGIELTKAQRKLMAESLARTLGEIRKLRAIPLDNAVPPAFVFDPDPSAPHCPSPVQASAPRASVLTAAMARGGPPVRHESDEDLAFASVKRLGELLSARQVSSTELTKLYLDRLKRYDPLLKCVITLTEETALAQAARADAEIFSGRWRGSLHGVPWGAKDLIAAPAAPTSWGAGPFRSQRFEEPAAVVERLALQGAVLVAKLTVGELAWGDVWYGGKTRNPWNPDQGSSGSSAGSAAATAAGLVGFAIGTETWGSIVSPCTRCGATGLRPTFGRVSRHGVMALAWTMDKIGPIARTAADCGAIFAAIHGRDPRDPSSIGRPFVWPTLRTARELRVGYVPDLFDEDYTKGADEESEKPGLKEWQEIDRRSLETLREMGVTLTPIRLPTDPPVGPLSAILTAEAAAAFDELTRSGRDASLVRQVAEAWPTVFRVGQMIPAVEYLRASRIRTLLMRAMERTMADLDAYVVPTFGRDNLLLTNLTGHPCVVLPNGFRSDGTPTSLTFIGKLHGESDLLALASAFQEATDFHLRRPPLDIFAIG